MSDNAYYDVAADEDLAGVWDEYAPIPSAGENDVLDAFLERKHLDHASLIRVGAKLADFRTLAFAGPGYVKYRNMETGQRWTSPGASWRQMRVARAQRGPASTVIVAEGETDAARLTMLYPEADVAILPGGAKTTRPEWSTQLEHYARVLASHDPDPAGDEGFEAFREVIPHAVRFLPPEGCKDWCELNGQPPPELPVVAAPTRWPHLRQLDVQRMLTTEPPPIEWIARPYAARSFFSMVAGREGRGKSLFTLHMAAAISSGSPFIGQPTTKAKALYIDAENGEREAHRRLHGLPVDLENFYYFDAGNGFDISQHLGEVEALLDEDFPADFILLDSLAALAGDFDDRDTLANEKVLRPLQRMAQRRNLSVVVLHHSPKYGAEYRGDTGMGAIVDLGWNISRDENDPRRLKRRVVRNWKMRAGAMAEDYWLSIEPLPDGRVALLEAPAFAPRENDEATDDPAL